MRSRRFLLCGWGGAWLALLALTAQAARWTLVDWGTSDGTTLTPYGDWTQLLRHGTYTQYLNPDGDSNHWGIAETNGIPEGSYAYFGIRGSTPISLAKGHKIVATFYNQTAGEEYLYARLSFADADSPAPAETTNRWYTMYRTAGPEVPGYSLAELEFYIADADMVLAHNAAPTVGNHYLVNISKPYNNNAFVLTKIELADEADLTAPTSPANLQARLTAVTAGCASNAVELTWNAATDPSTHATGVDRYLIYRDALLYDVVDNEMVQYLGTNLTYIDLTVAPGRPYAYSVTALDAAPVGIYPHGTNTSFRHGNESAHSATATVTTAFWDSDTLVNPWIDLRYAGAIRFPDGADWDYTSAGLAYYPAGNSGYNPTSELPGSLYAFTKYADAIGEISIPIPVVSTNADELPRATALQAPVDLWPPAYDGAKLPPPGDTGRAVGLAYHPATNGVSEYLYYGLCNYYDTPADAASHGCFDMDLTVGTGAWHLAGAPPSNVFPALSAKIAFAAPQDWAAANTGGRSLIVGNTYLSGCAVPSHGPSLYAIAPWESGNLPTNGGVVSAVELVRYSSGGTLSNRNINWAMDQFGEGGAWLAISNRAAVAISYRRSVGDTWYGDEYGNNNSTHNIPEPDWGGHGAHATDWKTGVMLYNPADLAAVAGGSKAYWEPKPYVVYDFNSYSLMAGGGDGNAGALAFDAGNGYLYFMEHNGDPGYEYGYGLIHAWRAEELNRPELDLALSNGTLRARWSTQDDGSSQQLQRALGLDAAADWEDVDAPESGDGGTKESAPLGTTSNAWFYRLHVAR
ncbi:MAG: hypothetical protein JXR37_08265 [Kiritimatiellae bacterium]|nr:hypothetical protein [Kiritimatiellia bacterium]